jgi:hypothetical protein
MIRNHITAVRISEITIIIAVPSCYLGSIAFLVLEPYYCFLKILYMEETRIIQNFN